VNARSSSSPVAGRFLRSLRAAVLLVTSVLLLFWQLPTVVALAAVYRPLWVEAGALGVLALVAVVAAPVVLRDRPWGPARWPLLVAAQLAVLAATAAVPASALIGPPHWAWEVYGWYALVLAMDRPGLWAGCVAVHLLLTVAQVAGAGRGQPRTLVGMAVVALVVGSWQLSILLTARALEWVAACADRRAEQEAALRTAESVAEQLHRDRTERYAALADSTLPLLAGLATRRISPDDPQVQLACRIEASRLRRLFAENDDVAHPLEHELRACIDVAERRGVAVDLAVRGRQPDLPRSVRRALADRAIAALATAEVSARVTVVCRDDSVVLSVIVPGPEGAGEGSAPPPPGTTDPEEPLDVSWFDTAGGTWLEAAWHGR